MSDNGCKHEHVK